MWDKSEQIREIFERLDTEEKLLKARFMQHPFNKELGSWDWKKEDQNGDIQQSRNG